MLKIDNLTITTHKGRTLVNDFSFVLHDSDKIALIGEEGNGKSTILKILAGIDVSDYVSYTGNITTDNIVGYLPQKIQEEWLDRTTDEYLFENGEVDYPSYFDVLNSISIDESLLSNRIVSSLSGGEKVKLMLFKLLYNKNDLLLLDEPTNDLDLETLIWLESFINKCDYPIIFISHDETLLRNCSNGILHLEQLKRKQECKLSFSGEGYEEYYQRRKHNIERTNQIAKKEKADFHKQLQKYYQIYQKVDHAQRTVSRQDPHGAALLKKKMHAVKALERNLEDREKNLTQKFEPEEAIDIFFEDIRINPNKIVLDYHSDLLTRGDRVLSRNIDLLVQGKDKICIIGKNGVGKSTLIKDFVSQLRNRDDIRLGYIPQNYYEVMDYDISPVDYLYQTIDSKTVIQTFLGSLKFTPEEMSHRISDLSEGQKCKILFAKIIMEKDNVLILDEPSRNLSPLSNPTIRNMLSRYDGTIISVSHDRLFIDEVCDKVYELTDDGLRLLQ